MVYKDPFSMKEAGIKSGDTVWWIDCHEIGSPIKVEVLNYYGANPQGMACSSKYDVAAHLKDLSNTFECSRIDYTAYDQNFTFVADTEEEALRAAKYYFLDKLNAAYLRKNSLEKSLERAEQDYKVVARVMANDYAQVNLYSEYLVNGYDFCKSKIDNGEL